MKWIVKIFSVSNLLSTTGDDVAFFEVFINERGNEKNEFQWHFHYNDFLNFIQISNPPLGRYLNRIRTSISGYGPKHSKILEVLNDENFDFHRNLQLYIDSMDDKFFEGIIEFQSKKFSLNDRKKLEEKMQMLDKVTANCREDNIKYSQFLDNVDETLHELTVKYYPSLFEKGEKYIAAYKDRLIRNSMNFAEDIDRIMHDKFNEYWEAKWNQGKS